MEKNQQSDESSADDGELILDVEEGFLDFFSEYDNQNVNKESNLVSERNEDLKAANHEINSLNTEPKAKNKLLSNLNWSDFGLCRSIMRVGIAISEMGYQNPTIIQSKVIPLALEGKDLLIMMIQGSGKTASFLIPTLQRLVVSGVLKQLTKEKQAYNTRFGTKALVILPTRELAAQCFQVFKSLSKYLSSKAILLTGGIPIKEQENRLRQFPETIICTPGRALDMLINSSSINVENIEVVIMDEADKLLELGFRDECLQVLKYCNRNRQTMLFSATLTEETKELVSLSLVNPVYVKVDDPTKVSRTLEFEMMMIPKEEYREACALYLCTKYSKDKTILFFQTKRSAHRMFLIFNLLNMKCGELHGNLSQSKRFESVERFKNGEIDYLLASELASRGLDIPGVKTVINVDLPTDITRYIHRVGRTARMGSHGKAITLYVDEQRSQVKLFLKKTSDIGATLSKNKKKVTSATLNKYKTKIDELEEKIKELLLEENIEKDIKMCDATLKTHGDQDREKRKWFRSKKDKKMASKEEFEEANRKTQRMVDKEQKNEINKNKFKKIKRIAKKKKRN
ncbi:DEAD-box family helicase, putative [Theileria annulata]|uniref:DEAD-box family helicase, putative n=1 Tax=Theileria annulata TaxID=5874 RepID=Q4U8S0_THEAN|nr:DEAD-box family helicase, putative [Theileria annulata]CAI76783.1 DEAD-box family helicase, putative [Theileria annulata]|eukprot:XP_953408.1 DEAD-box family helicase, putative [Theileria annulata]